MGVPHMTRRGRYVRLRFQDHLRSVWEQLRSAHEEGWLAI